MSDDSPLFEYDDTGKSADEIRKTPMYHRGDCVWIWVHEGDWLRYRDWRKKKEKEITG